MIGSLKLKLFNSLYSNHLNHRRHLYKVLDIKVCVRHFSLPSITYLLRGAESFLSSKLVCS